MGEVVASGLYEGGFVSLVGGFLEFIRLYGRAIAYYGIYGDTSRVFFRERGERRMVVLYLVGDDDVRYNS